MLIHTVKWISKINWGRVALVGVVYTIIATAVHQIEAIASLRYYMMPQYYGAWSKLMMPAVGPPPADFFITSTIITLTTGISLSLVYYYIRDMLPKKAHERILLFADLMIGLQFIFFTLPVYLLFNVPIELLISWFISNFLILVVTSFICVRIVK
ncbi:MAG: hypothetical protein V1922_04585 [bacterium]